MRTRRTCLLALALSLAMQAAFGQWLETTIMLPDSLGPLHWPYHMTTDATGSRLYVGSESTDVMVFDAVTLGRLRRINTASPVLSSCTNTRRNKVYLSLSATSSILVIDGPTGAVLSTIPIPTGPHDLVYNPNNDRVYCSNWGASTLTVLDCSADTVVGTVTLPGWATSICLDSAAQLLYAGTVYSIGGVAVVDCRIDSTVRWVSLGTDPAELCLASGANALYVAMGNDIAVVDLTGDSVRTALTNMGTEPLRLAYNRCSNRVYCIDSNRDDGALWVFDASADTVVAWAPWWNSVLSSVACNDYDKAVYVVVWSKCDYSYVAVLDGATNQTVKRLPVGRYFGSLHYEPVRRSLFAAGNFGTLSAIDCRAESVVDAAPLWSVPSFLCAAPDVNKVYFSRWDSRSYVGAVEAATNRVVKFIPTGAGTRLMCYNRTDRKLYCANGRSRDVSVVDALGDTVVAMLSLLGEDPAGMVWDEERDKLYVNVPDLEAVLVFDGRGDTLLSSIAVPPSVNFLVHLPELDKLYAYGGGRLGVVDCVRDSLVRVVPVSLGRHTACYSPSDAKVFFSGVHTLDVVDARTDSVVARIPGHGPEWNGTDRLVCVSDRHRVYWPQFDGYPWSDDLILAVDTRSDSVVRVMEVGDGEMTLCLDASGGRTYVVCSEESALYAIDNTCDSVFVVLCLPYGWPIALALSETSRRLYIGCGGLGLPVVRLDTTVALSSDALVPVRQTWLPTLVTHRLSLPQGVTADLLDATGRRATALGPGPNDIRRLSPGVYFVREQPQASSAKPQAIRKVVLTR